MMNPGFRFGLIGLASGLGLAASLAFAHSHLAVGSHHGGDRELLSLGGSPAQLAERAGRLADHVCAVTAQQDACGMQALASAAAADLSAMQPAYAERQHQLHAALLRHPSQRSEVDAIRVAQAASLQQAALRYSEFVAASADLLSAEQKLRFSGRPQGEH